MSTGLTQSISTASSKETEQFGERLGRNLKGGEIIELISDLGGGKTTLTRGIARGAGSNDVVGSPTFTLSKVYKTPKFDIYHYDFYRLQEAGLIEHELADILGDQQNVVIVEWGDVIQHVLPNERLSIRIDQTPDSTRKIHYACPNKLNYLVEA